MQGKYSSWNLLPQLEENETWSQLKKEKSVVNESR